MKRKSIFFVTMLILLGLVTMQSCKKESVVPFKVFNSFSTPTATAPVDGETIHITGTTVDLTWATTNPDNTASNSAVYFGTSATPPLFNATNATLTQTVTVELGLTYYWRVVVSDVHGVTTDSPTFSFTVFEPIGIFVGDFIADEPAEDYTYPISFTKSSPTTLLTDNYWNSGWAATFTLDFTANTYSMPLTVWGTYSGIESGTIDPATGTMTGNYTIYHPAGVAIETGVHTYTKVAK